MSTAPDSPRTTDDRRTPRQSVDIAVEVNGVKHHSTVQARRTLVDFLREDAGLTGTKIGCEHGVCGACTVLLDDQPVRSCLVLAVQAAGRRIRTVEGLADGPEFSRLQRAFHEHHALQCGFCTAGFLMTSTALLEQDPNPSSEAITETLSGSLCRCTGYQTIVEAVTDAAAANDEAAR